MVKLENSLALMSKAAQILAEANTGQKAKELKNLALTAADWAKRKGLGKQVFQEARYYALMAERKMGEMLAAVDLQHGARGIGKAKSGVTTGNPTPTLSEIGITKKESSQAKFLARLPDETFEAVKTLKMTRAQAKRDKKREDRESRLAQRESEAGKNGAEKSAFRLCKADILLGTPFEDGSIDAIITDPPYGGDAFELYSALSKEANRVLKPGGNCLVMTGQVHLLAFLNALSSHLTYQWELEYFTPGAATQIWDRKLSPIGSR